jgi:3-phenylpropionate/trans-cinnamate dioxygenase ferredoxin reductase component
LRGEPASPEFIAFRLKDERVIAGMNVNVWDVN